MRCLHKSALVVVAFETETKSLNFGGEVQHLLAPCRFTFADSLQREEGKRGEVRIGLFSSLTQFHAGVLQMSSDGETLVEPKWKFEMQKLNENSRPANRSPFKHQRFHARNSHSSSS
jgi:hypothetical protein